MQIEDGTMESKLKYRMYFQYHNSIFKISRRTLVHNHYHNMPPRSFIGIELAKISKIAE